MSRVEGGALRPQRDWYELGELVREVVTRLGRGLAEHSVELDVPDDLPPVALDYLMIDQVVTNLIENAAKYTPLGSPIRVAVEAAVGRVRVSVADRGPGIPADKRERVFDKFFRLETRSSVRGTGLGLAVSSGLVEAHGGRIWVEENSGGGSRFVFELPVSAPDGESDEPAGSLGRAGGTPAPPGVAAGGARPRAGR